jgi:hypothetical protein
MVLIARWTSVFDSGDDGVSFPVNCTVIATKIGDFDLASAEGSRGLIFHPEVADGRNLCPIGMFLSTGARPSFLGVDSRLASVTIRWAQSLLQVV